MAYELLAFSADTSAVSFETKAERTPQTCPFIWKQQSYRKRRAKHLRFFGFSFWCPRRAASGGVRGYSSAIVASSRGWDRMFITESAKMECFPQSILFCMAFIWYLKSCVAPFCANFVVPRFFNLIISLPSSDPKAQGESGTLRWNSSMRCGSLSLSSDPGVVRSVFLWRLFPLLLNSTCSGALGTSWTSAHCVAAFEEWTAAYCICLQCSQRSLWRRRLLWFRDRGDLSRPSWNRWICVF